MTHAAPEPEAGRLRRRMVDDLTRNGLLPPAWHDAFATVPRHAFLPRYFRLAADHIRYEAVAAGDPGWLTDIYSNTVLPTQLDSDDQLWAIARRTGPIEGTPTSSATMPSLMALMLDALDPQPGHRVLELGTGTGYNAALLCHRIGADGVTSVDVDAGLVERARTDLAAAGYQPAVATADAVDGYPDAAPYDRIIATVSVPAVPPAWLAQARPGAVVVTHLFRDLGGDALIRLTVDDHGAAHGHFLADHGDFMPVRAHHGLDPLRRFTDTTTEHGDTRPAADITITDDGAPALLLAALLMPGVARLEFHPEGGQPQQWLFSADSWACHTPAAGRVEQHGPRRLWDELETHHMHWHALGQPARQRFGLTVTPDGFHRLWLDNPARTVATLATPPTRS